MTNRNHSFKTAIAPWLIFPSLMGGGLFTTWLLLENGSAPATAGLISVLIFGFISIPILERLLPYRPHWNNNDADLGTDILCMISNGLIPMLWTPVQVFALTALTVWLTQWHGSSLWPDSLPLLAELALVLVIAEFGRYWVHYAAHKVPWLWRLHAVHHSPNRLYFLNANRFHPLEKLIFQLPEVAPFVLLGTPAEVIAMYFTFNGLHGLMQHSNIHIKAGWLNYVFSMTELHRWHHSQKIAESDQNFGNNLIIWDIVFGTFFNPKGQQVSNIGLLNPNYPKRWLQLLANPFHKRDLSKPTDWKAGDEHG